MPIGRDYPHFHLRRAVTLRSIVASHRSVIKNDKGKWDQRRFSRAGQVQITGALHGVGWKLVLGIEGGAQGNCYTANGFTSACLPPALTLPSTPPPPFPPSPAAISLPHVPFSILHYGNQFPSNYSYWYCNTEQSRWYPLSLLSLPPLPYIFRSVLSRLHTPLSLVLLCCVYEGRRFAT